jgi:aldose 1-epimerase
MHGLILASQVDVIVETSDEHVTATLECDFGDCWLSETALTVGATVRPESIEFAVTTRNAAVQELPVGIGLHPCFALPSKRREQARLQLPARKRALVNDYDEVFPTGRVESVWGTPYDFTAHTGAAFGSLDFDDSFVDLEKTPQGHTVVEIVDPAAHYRLRLTALSPEVRALQVYSPPRNSFVVVEPQFNSSDPFTPVWPPGTDTGMVL